MTLYTSIPQTVEAIQWHGDNWTEVSMSYGDKVDMDHAARQLFLLAGKDGAQEWVPVPVGHWLVHQPDDPSDVWPVDPDYFAAKYVPAQKRCDRSHVPGNADTDCSWASLDPTWCNEHSAYLQGCKS